MIVIGIMIWLSMNYEIIGSIIIIGVLIIATRLISPLAVGLTDSGIQYELIGTSGGSGLFSNLTRMVQFVPYKNIKKINLEEKDILKLKFTHSVHSITIEFSSEVKDEVKSILKKNNVL
ncbi:hypothetical protein J2T56_001976 [Natronobacillus azotifigens]|uniref:Uncharacterized protein n=1 Tax=Natronobacillus azotifigens TaxID=472978 RepID=A0A9J6RDJ6_9BACI|nr:hypothetical protein [Natronobacillus azotifigens]MCZ0703810.1 hypothetical protein [Natronobacillus azotifigens]